MNKTIANLIFIIILIFAVSNNLKANSSLDLSYYLPDLNNYNQQISKPEDVLGYQVGEWHVRPEQVERYFIQLAAESPRVKLHTYGYSHQKRPLFLAYISSEENINNLETIREQHLLMKKDTNRAAVTWMGYSVHGNEASGSNASLLFAYHLVAAQDEKTLAQLDNQIIIIDPMLNPDGLARFAHWANMYKSKNPNSDPNTREHNEAWPNGRTNHYWFDLNRDWLLLQHPESRGRIKMFHHWKPNVLTDFHEMGTNSTYFFQPGVKSRQNPLTPKENFQLTSKIAEYHAAALDEIGSMYYTKESFDDFYYGKGSTYPDIHGAVGILFEQASARGHLQESVNGDVSFPFAIRNQLTTSFSTLKAVQEKKKSLLSYQRNFYQKVRLNAKASKNRAIVYSSTDAYRLSEFNQILKGHQIEFSSLAKSLDIKGEEFEPKNSYIIPMQQAQYSLINSMFEKRKEFEDNTFYDVSSWNMPLAFDINFQMVGRSDYDKELFAASENKSNIIFEEIEKGSVALAFSWNDFSTANLLSYFHKNKIKVRMVGKPVKLSTSNGYKILKQGDIIVPVKAQDISREELTKHLHNKLAELNISPIVIKSGLSIDGPDLGSPSIPLLNPVNPLMIVGDGVSPYQAGEVWHLLDQRLGQDLTMMTADEFSKVNPQKYTHIVMVDGNYNLSEKVTKKINHWIKNGGILVTQSRASKWVSDQGWLSSEMTELKSEANTALEYADIDDTHSEHFIGGAITSTSIDLSHPLSYGLSDKNLPVFKRRQLSFSEPKESFVSFARFNTQPLIAGYMSKANQDNIAGDTSMLVQGHGKGNIIAFSDDMNFRGFWLGTSRVFANALYFGDKVRAPQKTKEDEVVKP